MMVNGKAALEQSSSHARAVREIRVSLDGIRGWLRFDAVVVPALLWLLMVAKEAPAYPIIGLFLVLMAPFLLALDVVHVCWKEFR